MEIPSVTASLKKYKGKWGHAESKHLLKRTLFGAKKEDIDLFASRSLKFAIQQLLYTEEPTPTPPINHYNDEKYTDGNSAWYYLDHCHETKRNEQWPQKKFL
ncbi:hypothetical protein [Longitalea arenae]|uniref:hypothetical protein n=1 Tax=Longitalea arenae TaxID=2812558 RepID=UPI001968548C|nr:hypothetical protein [Longitalea arenae]